jgi:hypothetical protein
VEILNQSVRPGNRFVRNVEHLTAREHVVVVADVLLGVVRLVENRVDALVEHLVRHPIVVAKRLVSPEDARPRAFDEHHVRDGVEDLPIHLLLVEESAFAAVAVVRHLCYDRRRPYGHCAPNRALCAGISGGCYTTTTETCPIVLVPHPSSAMRPTLPRLAS